MMCACGASVELEMKDPLICYVSIDWILVNRTGTGRPLCSYKARRQNINFGGKCRNGGDTV
eukprot:5869643-Amphidinium_carterae.1